MGLLSEGSPLDWTETERLKEHVRENGIEQFIQLYHSLKDRQGDILRWGDEVEYLIVKLDHHGHRATVSLSALPLLAALNQKEKDDPTGYLLLSYVTYF